MKIVAISIRNFRSAEDTTIRPCGQFNVFIGKNNSGKSNIFTAIEGFYACLLNDGLIDRAPIVSRPEDFHLRRTSLEAAVRLDFQLSNSERQALVDDIIAERAELKTAAEALPANCSIGISVYFSAQDTYFGYIADVIAYPSSDAAAATPLIRISDRSARSLFEISKQSAEARAELRHLAMLTDRLSERDVRILKDYVERGDANAFRYVLGSRASEEQVSRQLSRSLDASVRKAANLEDIRSTVSELSTARLDMLEELSKRPIDPKVQTLGGQEATIPEYITKLLKRVADGKPLHLRDRRREIGVGEAQKLLNLKISRGGPEVLARLQASISSLLGVKVDAFSGSSSKRGMSEGAELDVDDFVVEVNGTGIREALRVILDTEFEKPSILLVEEPEIHLHPALETSLMQYLRAKSSDTQIFITTHSTNFLDTADTQSIFLIEKKPATTATLLPFGNGNDRIARELGVRLSSLFMFDRIVFVEGISDELILRALADVAGINLNQRNVGFIYLKGAGNFASYAAEEILNFLVARQVQTWFLLDRDERTDEERRRIAKQLEKSARIAFTAGRELENSLLSPAANHAYLKSQLVARNDTALLDKVSSDKVGTALREAALSLKAMTLNKHAAAAFCRPVYAERTENYDTLQVEEVRGGILQKLQAMTDELVTRSASASERIGNLVDGISARWETDALSLAPGSEILRAFYSQYGIKFSKLRDGAAIARLYREGDIDPGVLSLLTEIGD